MVTKDWIWVIVTLLGLAVSSVLYVHKTFASSEDLQAAGASLQTVHQYDFYEAKQEYYTDRITALEQKQAVVELTPSEAYDLNHLREEVDRMQKAQEQLLQSIAE